MRTIEIARQFATRVILDDIQSKRDTHASAFSGRLPACHGRNSIGVRCRSGQVPIKENGRTQNAVTAHASYGVVLEVGNGNRATDGRGALRSGRCVRRCGIDGIRGHQEIPGAAAEGFAVFNPGKRVVKRDVQGNRGTYAGIRATGDACRFRADGRLRQVLRVNGDVCPAER